MLLSYRQKMMIYWGIVLMGNILSVKLALSLGMGAFFGWLYSLAFAFSALPQSHKSIKEGHAEGVANGTLILWALGEFAGVIYGFHLMQMPIILNCLMNTLFVGIIVWYKVFPRTRQEVEIIPIEEQNML
jgi:uncharacterized protein with PQ loop repeat